MHKPWHNPGSVFATPASQMDLPTIVPTMCQHLTQYPQVSARFGKKQDKQFKGRFGKQNQSKPRNKQKNKKTQNTLNHPKKLARFCFSWQRTCRAIFSLRASCSDWLKLCSFTDKEEKIGRQEPRVPHGRAAWTESICILCQALRIVLMCSEEFRVIRCLFSLMLLSPAACPTTEETPLRRSPSRFRKTQGNDSCGNKGCRASVVVLVSGCSSRASQAFTRLLVHLGFGLVWTLP